MPSNSFNITPTGGANVAQVLQGRFREIFVTHPNMQVFRYDNASGTYKDQNGNVGKYRLTHNYKDIPINFYEYSSICGVIDRDILNSGYVLFGRSTNGYVLIDRVRLSNNTSFGREEIYFPYTDIPGNIGCGLSYNYLIHETSAVIYFLFTSHYAYYSNGSTTYVVASFNKSNGTTSIISETIDFNTSTSRKMPISKMYQVRSGTFIYNCWLTVHEVTKQIYLEVITFNTSNNTVTTFFSNPVTLPTSLANKLTSEDYLGMIFVNDPDFALQRNAVSMYFGKNIKVRNPDNNLNFSGYLYFGTAHNTYDRKILRVPFSFTLNTSNPGASTFSFQTEKEFYFSIKTISANKYYYRNNTTNEEIFTYSPINLPGYTLVSQVDRIFHPAIAQYSIEIQDDVDDNNFTAYVFKNVMYKLNAYKRGFLFLERFTSNSYSKIISSLPLGPGRATSFFTTHEKVTLDRAYEQATNQFSLPISFGFNEWGDVYTRLFLYSLNSLPYNYTPPTSSTDYVNISKEPYYVKWTDPSINYYEYDQALSTTAGVPVYKNNHSAYFNTYTAINFPSASLITPVLTFLVPGDGFILPANTIISHYTYIDNFSTLPSRYQNTPYSQFIYNVATNSPNQQNAAAIQVNGSSFNLTASFIVKFVISADTKNVSLHGIQGSTDVYISTFSIVPITYKSLYHYFQDAYANIAVLMFNAAKFDLDNLLYRGSNYSRFFSSGATNYFDTTLPRSYVTFVLQGHLFAPNLKPAFATNIHFEENTNTVKSVILKHDYNDANFAPALYIHAQKDTFYMSSTETLSILAEDPKQVGFFVNLGENLRCGDVVIFTQGTTNYYYEIISNTSLGVPIYPLYYHQRTDTSDRSVYFLILYNVQ